MSPARNRADERRERPLVVSCSGATAAARLAGEIADALARLGVVERFDGELEPLLEQARAGRAVIVVDGCPSACRAQLLEAQGVQPAAVISPEDLGGPGSVDALARAAADRIAKLEDDGKARPRRGRHAAPTPPARAKRAHSVEDYLLAIQALSAPVADCGALVEEAPTLAAHVAAALGISRAAGGEMLERLERDGLIQRSARKEVLLTAAGRAAADRAARRHRVLERFLTDSLGYAPAEAHDEARSLRPSFTDEMVERLAAHLGAERCPHGWPLDPAREREERRELSALSGLGEGATATVLRLAEHDGALLARLFGAGLAPGADVEVVAADRRYVTVRVGGAEARLTRREATAVLVRAAA